MTAARASATLCRRRRSFGSFLRRITLPDGSDPAAITPEFNDGVLEVVVPAALPPKAHRIPILGRAKEAEKPRKAIPVH
jgi:HSP20 family molecular chaperone IbpA